MLTRWLYAGVLPIMIAGSAVAQTPGASPCDRLSTFSRTSFIAADQNGDGVIDEAEFASDVAAAFAGEDANMDERLASNELPEAPSGTVTRMDLDRSGGVSFREVMEMKMAEFQRADTNGDGVLTIDEVMRFNVARHGGC